MEGYEFFKRSLSDEENDEKVYDSIPQKEQKDNNNFDDKQFELAFKKTFDCTGNLEVSNKSEEKIESKSQSEYFFHEEPQEKDCPQSNEMESEQEEEEDPFLLYVSNNNNNNLTEQKSMENFFASNHPIKEDDNNIPISSPSTHSENTPSKLQRKYANLSVEQAIMFSNIPSVPQAKKESTMFLNTKTKFDEQRENNTGDKSNNHHEPKEIDRDDHALKKFNAKLFKYASRANQAIQNFEPKLFSPVYNDLTAKITKKKYKQTLNEKIGVLLVKFQPKNEQIMQVIRNSNDNELIMYYEKTLREVVVDYVKSEQAVFDKDTSAEEFCRYSQRLKNFYLDLYNKDQSKKDSFLYVMEKLPGNKGYRRQRIDKEN